jgi:hypothetical protein
MLFLMILLTTFEAKAAWTKIHVSKNETEYYDYETMAISDQKITIWKLQDFQHEINILGIKYRSRICVIEVDCVKKSIKEIATATFTSQMGEKGSDTASFTPTLKSYDISKLHSGKAEWNAACTHEKYTNQKKKSG